MVEQVESEKRRKAEELQELGRRLEREYEDRVRRALGQLRSGGGGGHTDFSFQGGPHRQAEAEG
jgi:hypothetical protein